MESPLGAAQRLRGIASDARATGDFFSEAIALRDALHAFIVHALGSTTREGPPEPAALVRAFLRSNDDARFGIANTVARLAMATLDGGHPELALQWFEIGSRLFEEFDDPEAALDAGRLEVARAVALRQLNRFGEAEDRIDIAQRLLPADAIADRAALASVSALVAARTGRRKQAVSILRDLEPRIDPAAEPAAAAWVIANRAMIEDGPAGRYGVAIDRLLRARGLLLLSRFDAARQTEIEQSLALFALLDGDPRALDFAVRALALAAAHPRPDVVWRALEVAAGVLARADQASLATLLLKHAIDGIEAMRRQRADADQDLGEVLQPSHAFVFDLLARLLVRDGRLGEARGVLDRKIALPRANEMPPMLSLTDEEAQAGPALAEALAVQARHVAPDMLAQTLSQIGARLGQARQRIHAQARALNATLRDAHRARLPAAARADTLVLHVIQDETTVTVLASVDGIELLRDGAAAQMRSQDLHELAHAFVAALLACRGSDARHEGRTLHRLLVEPAIRACPPGVRRILIVAPGALHGLPWAALPSADGRFLVQSFDLVRGTAPGTDLARAPRSPMTLVACAADAGGEGHSPLPHALHEVRGLQAQRELAGAASFTRAALEEALPHASVLHVASHFIADPANLARSRLLLGDGGALGLPQLVELGLANLDLIVLSACDSGVAGSAGAGAAFAVDQLLLASRVPAVVGTLFPVADHATAELMRRFHAHLRAGSDKARALAAAQRAFIDGVADPAWRQPRFWAAPVLSGNWLGWPQS